jgi:drug/metabolite transporter (DMT)-like permease
MPQVAFGVELSNEVVGEIQLILAVLFFGISFVLQRGAMVSGIPPLTYNAVRYSISMLVMLAYKGFELWWAKATASITGGSSSSKEYASVADQEGNTDGTGTDTLSITTDSSEINRKQSTNTWSEIFIWGSLLGVTSIGGSIGQQIGLVTVSAGKTAFITGLFVIVTPFAESVAPGYNVTVSRKCWMSAAVSVVGLALLSGCAEQDVCFGGAIGPGEILVFASMFMWVISILASDKGSKTCDVVWLSIVDFAITASVTSVIAYHYEPAVWEPPFALLLEGPHWRNMLLVGMTEAIAFNLANLGQEYTPPTRASLLYSMEGIAASIFGYVFLREMMTLIEMMGCALILGATVLSSLDIDLVDWDLKEEEEEQQQQQQLGGGGGRGEVAVKRAVAADTAAAAATTPDSKLQEVAAEQAGLFEQKRSFGSIEML